MITKDQELKKHIARTVMGWNREKSEWAGQTSCWNPILNNEDAIHTLIRWVIAPDEGQKRWWNVEFANDRFTVDLYDEPEEHPWDGESWTGQGDILGRAACRALAAATEWGAKEKKDG